MQQETVADELEEAYRNHIWDPSLRHVQKQKQGVTAARVELTSLFTKVILSCNSNHSMHGLFLFGRSQLVLGCAVQTESCCILANSAFVCSRHRMSHYKSCRMYGFLNIPTATCLVSSPTVHHHCRTTPAVAKPDPCHASLIRNTCQCFAIDNRWCVFAGPVCLVCQRQ